MAILRLHPVQALKAMFGRGEGPPPVMPMAPEADELSTWGESSLSAPSFEEYMKLTADRVALYKEYKELDNSGDIPFAANELYAADAVQISLATGRSLWISSKNPYVEELGMQMLDDIEAEDNIFGVARAIVSDGDCFDALLQEARDDGTGGGIIGTENVEPESIWIHKDKYGRIVGYNRGLAPDAKGKLYLPWEYIHFRLLGRSRRCEYGESIHFSTRTLFRRLKLVEDSAVLYRIKRTPDRYRWKFKKGGGMSLPQKIKWLNAYRQNVVKRMAVDQDTGKTRGEMKPTAITDDLFYFDDDVEVDRLTGSEKVDHVLDIDYLRKRLLGLYHIPPDYLGFADAKGGSLGVDSPLAAQDIQFARMVKKVQRALIVGYMRLADINLIWRGIDPFEPENEFTVYMEPVSYLEEKHRAEVTATRAQIINSMKQIGSELGIDKDKWITVVMKMSGFPQDFFKDTTGEDVSLKGKVELSEVDLSKIEKALGDTETKQLLVEHTDRMRRLADSVKEDRLWPVGAQMSNQRLPARREEFPFEGSEQVIAEAREKHFGAKT